jgi:hypothetical protein
MVIYPGAKAKITDTDSEVSKFGRADNFWHQKGFRTFFNKVRPGLTPPAHRDMMDLQARILKLFSIRGIEFGNWVTNEDRFNYVVCLYFSLYDLNKILHFNGNIGLANTIAVAFGARGSGRAIAHFEPGNNVINITRYDKDVRETDKPHSFATSGGMGAFAHEYGHALDYFFGSHIEQSLKYRSLTYGHTYSYEFKNVYQKNTLRYLAVEIVRQAVQNDKAEQSPWYRRMLKNPSTSTEYFRRHNEIFARLFEQYIQYKLGKVGVTNKLLSQTKYESTAYMRPAEFEKIIPLFNQLTSKMADVVKK